MCRSGKVYLLIGQVFDFLLVNNPFQIQTDVFTKMHFVTDIKGLRKNDRLNQTDYCTRASTTRGLYSFTPFFTAVYNQERLILQTTYVVKRGNSSKNAAVYNQERFQIKSGL